MRLITGQSELAISAADLLVVEARGDRLPVSELTRQTVFDNQVLGIVEQNERLVAAAGFATNKKDTP